MSREEREREDNERDRLKAAKILEDQGLIPPNNYFDDANLAYAEIDKAIGLANEMLGDRIQAAMATPERRALIKDEPAVAANLHIVTKDILSCRAQLAVILPRHAGKTGGANTPDELIEIMEINDLYRAALSLYNSNVMPVVAHIFELLGEDAAVSEQALQEQAIMADNLESIVIKHDDGATDPNVVTDVVIKSPTVISDVDNKTNES
jgi:hypothetical protein